MHVTRSRRFMYFSFVHCKITLQFTTVPIQYTVYSIHVTRTRQYSFILYIVTVLYSYRMAKMYGLYGFLFLPKIVRKKRIMSSQIVWIFEIFSPENNFFRFWQKLIFAYKFGIKIFFKKISLKWISTYYLYSKLY